MRIHFVIQKIAGRSGGAERVLIETANEMAERGHSVEILSHETRRGQPFYPIHSAIIQTNLFDRPKSPKSKQRWQRREHFREAIPHVYPLSHWKWRMTNLAFIRSLRRHISARQPDVLVPFLPPAITAAAIAASRVGVPVVASTHNVPAQDYTNPERWDPNPVDVRRRFKALSSVDKILVLLPEFKDWFPDDLKSKILDMPNPVRPVDKTALDNAVRQKTILGVGRLAAVKRFDLLIDAWATIKDEFPGWKVDIFGHGPDLHELQARIVRRGIADTFKLRGVTDQIAEQLLSASVFAHPAEFEGFGLAIAEALAHGLPVVGFADCSGLNTLVRHEETGILVEPGSDRARSMADALRRILTDEETRTRLGSEGPASMRQYAPQTIYDRWERVLTDAAESHWYKNHRP